MDNIQQKIAQEIANHKGEIESDNHDGADTSSQDGPNNENPPSPDCEGETPNNGENNLKLPKMIKNTKVV